MVFSILNFSCLRGLELQASIEPVGFCSLLILVGAIGIDSFVVWGGCFGKCIRAVRKVIERSKMSKSNTGAIVICDSDAKARVIVG